MGRSLSQAYHLVALLNARFAKSDMASLFIRIFCIARELFLMSFSFGLSLKDRVLSGIISVNGGNVVELPLVTAVLVIGDTDVIPTVDASGASLFALFALSRARRAAICFLASLLSLSKNLHARIASGTVDLGQRNRYATVHPMRLSTHRPFPDMLMKTLVNEPQGFAVVGRVIDDLTHL